jgi:hypothetical protein
MPTGRNHKYCWSCQSEHQRQLTILRYTSEGGITFTQLFGFITHIFD